MLDIINFFVYNSKCKLKGKRKMLSYFTIKNFKSILDLTLDLSFAEGKAPNGYEESEFLPFVGTKTRYVPTLALFGANASGKTNILYALKAFQGIIARGVVGLYIPNKLNPKYNSTTFEVGVDLEGKKYIYSIEYNQDGIIHEGLYKKNKEEVIFEIQNGETSFDGIATKEYTSQRLKEIFKVECQNENKQQWLPFLTCLCKNYKRLNNIVISVGNYLLAGVEVYVQNNIPLPVGLEKLAKIDTPETISEAFNKITTILKKLDIDINKMTLERKYQTIEDPNKPINIEAKEGTFFGRKNNMLIMDEIRSYHTDTNGNEVVFNFSEESEGTRTLSGLLGICLSALEDGKIVFIDELENSLHPCLLKEVIRLFKDKRYNTKNAQLVFTAHNTDILDDDLIRVSEVGIVNKTMKKGSTIKRISDFEGIRNVYNFRKQYLNGLFSGLPYPYI